MKKLSVWIAASTLLLAGCATTNVSQHAMNDASMSMSDMTNELKDKTGDAFDRAFISMMIPHHQGAIDMAQLALRFSKHEEIRKMARDILSAQQREIDQMKTWEKAWGYAK